MQRILLALVLLSVGCAIDHTPPAHGSGQDCTSCHVYVNGGLIVPAYPDAGVTDSPGRDR